MTYVVTTRLIGVQPIENTSTVQEHGLGTIVEALDPILGSGEFVYLAGVASTAVGSVVAYNPSTGVTSLLAEGNRGPVAIAKSANVANQYGWYQISGVN